MNASAQLLHHPQQHQPKDVGEKDRKSYIGGSDIAALLGLDPYDRTPLTVYLQKIGELQGITDPEKVKFLKRRKRWEAPIVEMLREEFDGKIVAVNQRYEHEQHAFLAAEIDFEWQDGDGFVQNGEIKTVTPFAFNEQGGWGEPGTGDIPVHYEAQVQFGLGITGRERCIVAAMIGLDNMHFYEVRRDDQAIAGMLGIAVNFWQHHVLARNVPAPTTMDDIMRLFSRRKGRPVDLDPDTAQALYNLREIRARMAALKGDADELELKVATFVCEQWGIQAPEESEDNGVLRVGGVDVCKWNSCRGAHLDQKRLAAEHPEIKAAYTVPHYYRSFRFPKK